MQFVHCLDIAFAIERYADVFGGKFFCGRNKFSCKNLTRGGGGDFLVLFEKGARN